ncbi:MAG: bifunctional diguanylate cyclase/phosphodiesterase [Actinomycetota bacterium]|nr:bifunctional diguanylate cyclase/phosphodiesterase [Actinomycetota bacterium]
MLSRVFDRSVLLVGLVLAGVSAIVATGAGAWSKTSLAMLLCIPVIVIVARYPVTLDRPGGAIEIGFDSVVLALLGTLTPAHDGALIWTAGAVASQLLSGNRPIAKVFNVGVMTTSGIAALWIIQWLGADEIASVWQFAAVIIGCAVYFALDFAISEVSVALEHSTPFSAALGQTDVIISMLSIVAVDSLGYLAALVLDQVGPWAMLLLAVPVATLLVASKSTARDRERSRRMRVLFDASRSVQSQTSAEDVLALLQAGARELVRVQQCGLRDTPPGAGEVGARVTDGSRDWWLVTPEWQRVRATVASDREHLDQLALAGSEALSRLKLTREMTFLARHDTLTELANRAVLLDRVEHALEVARRRGSTVAVLFCDLDGFKQINDRFGHNAGDAVLVTTAQRISRCVRGSDTVARLGGDEFAVLLEDIRDPIDLDRVTSLLLAAVVERIEVSGHLVSVSTSIGIATSDGTDSGEGLLRSADIAMYEAKAQGKNCVARYQMEYGAARIRKLELVEALRAAIEDDALTVAYQPVFSVRTGGVTGLEALARWRHEGQDVSPSQFVPLAEETGLVVQLGERILDRVARDAKDIRRLGLPPIQMGVNISAQQLRSPSFLEQVGRTRGALGDLDLVLEVTERDVVREDSLSQENMARLVREGVQFAVDDFGIGFSSIGYLQNLPVQVLKTDRTFVADIETSERSANLLNSMLLMGSALGLHVVVEGVEREAQLQHLRTMPGEVFAQGYHLARPMPLIDVLSMLRRSYRLSDVVPAR